MAQMRARSRSAEARCALKPDFSSSQGIRPNRAAAAAAHAADAPAQSRRAAERRSIRRRARRPAARRRPGPEQTARHRSSAGAARRRPAAPSARTSMGPSDVGGGADTRNRPSQTAALPGCERRPSAALARPARAERGRRPPWRETMAPRQRRAFEAPGFAMRPTSASSWTRRSGSVLSAEGRNETRQKTASGSPRALPRRSARSKLAKTPPCRSRRAACCKRARRRHRAPARPLEPPGAQRQLVVGEAERRQQRARPAQAHALEGSALVARVLDPGRCRGLQRRAQARLGYGEQRTHERALAFATDERAAAPSPRARRDRCRAPAA